MNPVYSYNCLLVLLLHSSENPTFILTCFRYFSHYLLLLPQDPMQIHTEIPSNRTKPIHLYPAHGSRDKGKKRRPLDHRENLQWDRAVSTQHPSEIGQIHAVDQSTSYIRLYTPSMSSSNPLDVDKATWTSCWVAHTLILFKIKGRKMKRLG